MPLEINEESFNYSIIKKEDNSELKESGSDEVMISPANDNFVEIIIDSEKYSPVMSSVRGIGLTPFMTAMGNSDIKFIWKTNHGYFVEDWDNPEYEVEIENYGEKVYWTFLGEDNLAEEQPPIQIYFSAIDEESNEVFAEKEIELEWEDYGTVRVKR